MDMMQINLAVQYAYIVSICIHDVSWCNNVGNNSWCYSSIIDDNHNNTYVASRNVEILKIDLWCNGNTQPTDPTS